MSADTVADNTPARTLKLPAPLDGRHDRMDELVDRMRPVCALAVDADEVAAVLEATGINDRVARRDYDVTSVFSLAATVLLRSGIRAADRADAVPVVVPEPRPFPLRATLVRAALYLTPTVVALGAATQLGGLPTVATSGALVFGWGVSQALAFLGYVALGTGGPTAAARLLGAGFLAAGLGYAAALWYEQASWPIGYVVAGAQLALFAATAVALVTGKERRVLASAVPCWLSAAAMAFGGGPLASGALLVSLLGMLVVAYLPVVGSATWTWPRPRQYVSAVGYGAVGAGQAVLFVLVVLTSPNPGLIPVDAVPLLVGVPLIELVLLWHQRRVADGRATLDDRAAFSRHLRRVSRGTVAALCVPVFAGAALCLPVLAGHALLAGRLDGLPGQPRVATSVLLTAVYALCLVLVTHRRIITAAILVWWPAALVAVTAHTLPGWVHLPPTFTNWVIGLTLFAVCLPALVVVALVIRDPWSYR